MAVSENDFIKKTSPDLRFLNRQKGGGGCFLVLVTCFILCQYVGNYYTSSYNLCIKECIYISSVFVCDNTSNRFCNVKYYTFH